MFRIPFRCAALGLAAASLLGCAGLDSGRTDVLGQYFYVAQFCTAPGIPARDSLPVLVITNTHSEGVNYARLASSTPGTFYQGRAGGVQYAVAAVARWAPGQQYVWEMGRFSHLPKGQWSPWLPANFASADGNLAWAMVNVEPYQRSDTVPANVPKMRVMSLPYGSAVRDPQPGDAPVALPGC